MIKLVVIVGAVLLAGCSTAPTYNYQAPYCYTDQTIVKQDNESVSSTTTLECSDRPAQKTAIQRAGIDAKCEEFTYPETRRNTVIYVRGVRCEKLNDTWEIVNIDGNTR